MGRPRWDELIESLTLVLSEADTDAVTVAVRLGELTMELRYDFLRTGVGDQIWLATHVMDLALAEVIARGDPSPLTLSPGGRLPLAPTEESVEAPIVFVWRNRTAQGAAALLRAILIDHLSVPAVDVRIADEKCSPADLERRLNMARTVRRLTQRSAGRGPTVSTCDRCGLPLSDPASVKLGIGPECRKYYSPEILRAVATKSRSLSRPGSKREKEWLAWVRASWLTA